MESILDCSKVRGSNCSSTMENGLTPTIPVSLQYGKKEDGRCVDTPIRCSNTRKSLDDLDVIRNMVGMCDCVCVCDYMNGTRNNQRGELMDSEVYFAFFEQRDPTRNWKQKNNSRLIRNCVSYRLAFLFPRSFTK